LARAYFIGVAVIEEIGKSFIAFDSQGRNLSDSAVTEKIRSSLENHSNKIDAAFYASILSHGDLQKELQGIIDLMITLKYGREPSMYTDVDYESREIKKPKELVRDVAAKDCIRLAKHCYYKTQEYLQTKSQQKETATTIAFTVCKKAQVKQLFNNVDFWWYYIAKLEAGEYEISKFVVDYQREYLSKGLKFKNEYKSDNDRE
jgi:AbiV family abortive infection protein